jgi:hypothetical protein
MDTSLLLVAVIVTITVSSLSTISSAITSIGMVTVLLKAGKTTVVPIAVKSVPEVAVPVLVNVTVTGASNCFVVDRVKRPSVASSSACVVATIESSATSSSVMVTVAALSGEAAMVTSLLLVAVIVTITVSSLSTMSSAITSIGMVTSSLNAGKTTVVPIAVKSVPEVAVPVLVNVTVTGASNCFVVVMVNSPSMASSSACVVATIESSATSSSVMVYGRGIIGRGSNGYIAVACRRHCYDHGFIAFYTMSSAITSIGMVTVIAKGREHYGCANSRKVCARSSCTGPCKYNGHWRIELFCCSIG